MNIIKDNKKIEELLTRGVENIFPKKEFLEARLKEGRRLTLYTGYDPTAPTLHVGHGITLMKLRQFQDLGHRVIMLIGDFTGMIGDPTDKTAARKKLTREEVLMNCKNYQKQASVILDFDGENPVEVKYNSEWLGKMSFADVVELTGHFTVDQLMERDMFEKRKEEGKPIYLHEFLYPVMQGYDSVAMDVDGEVGGNDQTFNMLAGRDLMKDLKNKEKFVLTMKLLTDSSGKKMGKSEGNMIAFTDSAEDMFGKVMSWTDGMIMSGFELCTHVVMDEVKKMEKEMKDGTNPRDFKLKLAYEITKTFLGEDAAKKGQENFHKVIQSKDRPDEIPELKPSAYKLIPALVESGLAKSNSDARKLISGGGIRVNDIIVTPLVVGVDAEGGVPGYDLKPGDIIQKGKRFFVKIK